MFPRWLHGLVAKGDPEFSFIEFGSLAAAQWSSRLRAGWTDFSPEINFATNWGLLPPVFVEAAVFEAGDLESWKGFAEELSLLGRRRVGSIVEAEKITPESVEKY